MLFFFLKKKVLPSLLMMLQHISSPESTGVQSRTEALPLSPTKSHLVLGCLWMSHGSFLVSLVLSCYWQADVGLLQWGRCWLAIASSQSVARDPIQLWSYQAPAWGVQTYHISANLHGTSHSQLLHAVFGLMQQQFLSAELWKGSEFFFLNLEQKCNFKHVLVKLGKWRKEMWDCKMGWGLGT